MRGERFDYVVVDEVHHAAANSYRRILDAIDPRFLLGLTATPDRADAADILGLFDDYIAYRADIGRGVELGLLAPFHYFGVKDDIDYEQIPWRNKRFDPEALAQAAQTEARMQTMWRAWSAHPGRRSLVFCCSIAHAGYVRAWLRDHGVRADAVFSAEGSDDRDGALRSLEAGDIDALCAVDVFNEGIDVPSIDRVVMLRPTESSVIFLQQLGRGLRAAEGKTALTVIDFVGNDRMFLDRVRSLLALTGTASAQDLRSFLQARSTDDLPTGCSVELELEAKQMLERLFRVDGADQVERAYRELRLERGQRPTAGELQRMGFPPRSLRQRHGSWFAFVSADGDLDGDELRAFDAAGTFLRDVETTEMTKCFKMVTLEALLEEGALVTGLPLRALALRCHALLRRSPELFTDVAEDERVDEIASDREKHWIAYWRRNPIEAWTSSKGGRRWFRLEEDRFFLDLKVDPAIESALARLVRELVDYRLAQYRARSRTAAAFTEGFVCKVLSNQRNPILKLPSRAAITIPEGETDVRLSDGAVWQFLFAKEYCNVAHPPGRVRNELPGLLRTWFGPRAGEPGTAFEVRFHASPDGLWVEPMQAHVIVLPPRRAVIAYPELRAAAGHVADAIEPPDSERVSLPIDVASPELFAVRVTGSSMDGGHLPARDGDWAVMRVDRGASAERVAGRIVLVEVPGEAFGHQFQIKRLVRHDDAWLLKSDNPDGPTIVPSDDMIVVACLERVVKPEDLAPAPGSLLGDHELSAGFGLEDLEPRSGRHEGHLFVFVDRTGILEAPDTLRFSALPRRPAETAFALAKQSDGSWRYVGVARSDDGVLWRVPEVDHITWRMWGAGREVSRRVPDGALSEAQLAVDALLALPDAERSIGLPGGRRARILGVADRGGLRIDGGADGFAERTVSLLDIAWVAAADADVRESGGVLDEPRVNRLRYLEGTPKASTRWIDTGWAIAAWVSVRERVHERLARSGEPDTLIRDNGVPLNAAFRIEREGGSLTIVVESRGGARGAADERNVDYAEGLELILARLRDAGIALADAVIDSRDTARLPREERRLEVEGLAYPIAIGDAAELRKKLTGAAAKVGREPGARGGGNRTRRLRLVIAAGGGLSSEGQLRSWLRGPGRE